MENKLFVETVVSRRLDFDDTCAVNDTVVDNLAQNSVMPDTDDGEPPSKKACRVTRSAAYKKAVPKFQKPVSWKFKQLAQNQYTADIKKGEIRKNYEPEKCNCARAEEGMSGCESGLVNSSNIVCIPQSTTLETHF